MIEVGARTVKPMFLNNLETGCDAVKRNEAKLITIVVDAIKTSTNRPGSFLVVG